MYQEYFNEKICVGYYCVSMYFWYQKHLFLCTAVTITALPSWESKQSNTLTRHAPRGRSWSSQPHRICIGPCRFIGSCRLLDFEEAFWLVTRTVGRTLNENKRRRRRRGMKNLFILSCLLVAFADALNSNCTNPVVCIFGVSFIYSINDSEFLSVKVPCC